MAAPGLRYEHQQERERLLKLAMFTHCPGPSFGPRSPRCVGLMADRKHMDLDHMQARALGGAAGPRRIICTPCNRGSGARLGNALRGLRRRTGLGVSRRSRDW